MIVLFYSSFIDITGNPEKSRLEVFSQTNNSLSGNPFSGLSPDLTDSVDSDTECQADESVIAVSAWDNHQFAELEQRYAHTWLYSKLCTLYIPVYLGEMFVVSGKWGECGSGSH